MSMLRLAHWDLSSELADGLREDATLQSNCGEIIGIDFDPFLLTQDPATSYEIGDIEQKHRHYMAKVYRVEEGQRKETPDVIAEIARRSDGRWYFVNFYSPEISKGLVAILKSPMPKCSVPRPKKKEQ